MYTGTCNRTKEGKSWVTGKLHSTFYIRKRDDEIKLVNGYTFEACFSEFRNWYEAKSEELAELIDRDLK